MGFDLIGELILRSLELLLPELYFLLFVKEQSEGRYTWRYVSKFIGENRNLQPYVNTWIVALVGFIIYLISNPTTKFLYSQISEESLIATFSSIPVWLQVLSLAFVGLLNLAFIYFALKA